jgi:NAD(P)-dependent dehydrogenase (short-subunit alcohol dehydrogenase family)
MDQLRFDGRTAIVTGAGGNPGLGRAYALLLAERGANVIVNDLGSDPESQGYYRDTASAEAVVREIRAQGGKAVADTHSVATEEGAAAVVQAAIDAFGSVDVVVNNAVVSVLAPFDEITSRDFRRHIEANLMGPIWICRAAWPHMRAKGYGRIVNIGSGAFTGCSMLSAYGISKGGVFALTRSLAAEGRAYGILANTVTPAAFTRGAIGSLVDTTEVYGHFKENLPPELVAPVVAYLAHESCPVSGECIDTSGGNVRRIYVALTEGFTDSELTIEKLAQRWDEVTAGAAPGVIDCGTAPAEIFRRTPAPAKYS